MKLILKQEHLSTRHVSAHANDEATTILCSYILTVCLQKKLYVPLCCVEVPTVSLQNKHYVLLSQQEVPPAIKQALTKLWGQRRALQCSTVTPVIKRAHKALRTEDGFTMLKGNTCDKTALSQGFTALTGSVHLAHCAFNASDNCHLAGIGCCQHCLRTPMHW